MGLLSGAINAIGIGIQAYGQYKQGQDAKDVYQYNEEVARLQAEYIKDASKIQLSNLARDVNRYVGRQRAIVGKSGTVSSTGSNLDVVNQAYNQAEIDAGIIRWRTSKMYEMAKKGANLLGTQANQFESAGNLSAATTILGGLSKFDWKRNSTTTASRGAYYPGPKTGY